MVFDARRLETLRQTQLLDAEPPEDLQRLTRLASRRFGVEVALVSLIDSHRQFFAAHVGLAEPFCSSRETGLDSSFCRHVAVSGESLVVTDARTHPLMCENGAVELLGVVAYAGMPIVTADGERLGSFCVVSPRPRSWTPEELSDLADFAATASALINARVERSRLVRAEREKLDLLNRITEGFASFDREWRVTFANGVAARLTGRALAEALGKSLWDLVPALVGTPIGLNLLHVMAHPGVYDLEWRGVANPGWFEARAVSSSDGLSLYIRDITRRKESERALMQSEARFRELAEIAPIGIFETDASGSCTWVNRRARELTWLAGEAALGAGWATAIAPEDATRCLTEWTRCVSNGEPFAVEARFRHSSGTLRWVSVSASPIRDGSDEVTGYVGTIEDVNAVKTREQSLQQLVSTFEQALRGSDTGMWDWHIPSGEVRFTEQMGRMLGYSAEEFGSNIESWAQRVHPDDLPIATEALTRHFRGETPYYRFPHRIMSKWGEWRWILDAGAVVERDAQGNPIRMLGTHVDVHEAKAAEARFRTLFEKANEPLLLVDVLGVVDCNTAAAAALGFAHREQVIGPDYMRFIPPRQPDGSSSIDRLQAVVERLMRGEAQRFDWMVRRTDGSEFLVVASLTPLDLEAGGIVLVSLHDLSVRAEQERTLREAKEAAEATTRAKSDFLARMSHELRSPLNSVIGFSRLLLQSPIMAGAREHVYLERIHANGVHLLSLINDVLDISRIEAGRSDLRVERVDLAEMVRQTVEQGEGLLGGRRLALLVELPVEPLPIDTDPQKLRRVLINLLGNAIKFTQEGSVLTRVIIAPDGRARALEVQDTGIGIPAEKLQAIFEPFEQVESGTSRRFEGSGLGLAISRQLCEVMGYRLSVQSMLGQGSTFRIDFADDVSDRR